MLEADNPELAEARKSFHAFYSIANADEKTWMDALILSWKAYFFNTQVPREVFPDGMRSEVERVGDKVEALFMRARRNVQECSSFRRLCEGDRKRIESILFSPYLPEK